MGRGAGNLPTELLAQYINKNLEARYQVTPLLAVVDRYLNAIYARSQWGYSTQYFLASINGCHPNYATYLMNKSTLSVEDISKILNEIPIDSRSLYNESLVEKLYLDFQDNKVNDEEAYIQLGKLLSHKPILILAPGNSIKTKREIINNFIEHNSPIIISVNFVPDDYYIDFLFVSNLKRMETLLLSGIPQVPMIITSNLKRYSNYSTYCINYFNLLGEGAEADNAGAMLIRMLRRCKVEQISLAGFDGFHSSAEENYYNADMYSTIDSHEAQRKNENISRQIRLAAQDLPLRFITDTKYVNIG